MLGNPHDVKMMVLGGLSEGILHHMRPGTTLVDHTTSSPELAEIIHDKAIAKDVHSVDAPVSGGSIGAQNGKLVTMVGGTQEGVDSVRTLLDAYSQEVEHMGQPGAG